MPSTPLIRRAALVVALAIALWILIAYPDWVGIPVACVVIVLLALLTYVQADRDRLLRSNEVLRDQLDRAEADATTHAGIATRSIALAADLTNQLEKAHNETKVAQSKQYAAEIHLNALRINTSGTGTVVVESPNGQATLAAAEPTPVEYADVRPQQSWWQQ